MTEDGDNKNFAPQNQPVPATLRLVKNDSDRVAEAVGVVLWLLFLYAWSSPTAFDKLVDFVRARWRRWQYLVSVWQTQRSIETLPEIDEPQK